MYICMICVYVCFVFLTIVSSFISALYQHYITILDPPLYHRQIKIKPHHFPPSPSHRQRNGFFELQAQWFLLFNVLGSWDVRNQPLKNWGKKHNLPSGKFRKIPKSMGIPFLKMIYNDGRFSLLWVGRVWEVNNDEILGLLQRLTHSHLPQTASCADPAPLCNGNSSSKVGDVSVISNMHHVLRRISIYIYIYVCVCTYTGMGENWGILRIG